MSSQIDKFAQDIILDADKNRQANTTFPTATLPDNYKVVDLEKFEPERNQFRAGFNTNSIDDFKLYADKFGKEDDTCFVNSDHMSARIVFDMGDPEHPGHCRHDATLKLEKTAPYLAVLGVMRQAFTQKELFNFLQDWKNNITAVDGDGEGISFATAAQNILSININESVHSGYEETDMSASRSAMAKIEAEAKEGRVLPAGFIFTSKPYLPLGQRDFYLRLGVRKKGDSLALTLRCDGLEDIKESIVEEFGIVLNGLFGNQVIKGTFTS
jgi:uncharacterized protein YfdQ (DUF2303 family)